MVKIFFSLVIVLWATVASANILGNMQTFSPNPDSLFFENVHASKTLRKNHFNLGYYMSYVRNQLSVYEPLGTQNFINYKDKSVTFDFVAAWGITDNFEITYALPGFIQQAPDSGQYQNNYVSDGINTHRPGVKYDISQSSSGGLAVLASVDFPVTKNDPYTGTDVDPIYNLELAYDVRGKTSAYAFNLGYRFRSPGNLPANSPYFFPLQDQILLSAGYVTALNTNRRYHFELYGAMAADKDPHLRMQHVSALEGLIAFKQKIHKGLWGHIGATGEILREGLAPQYRVYAGVNWFFGIEDKNEAASSNQPVSVDPAPVDVVQETASEITVDPSNIELFEGGEIDVAVSGGAEPLIYELSKPFGEFNSNAMTYFAPARPGEVQLIITDALNQRKTVNIKVIPVPKANKEVVIKGLFFKFNTDELTVKSKKILDENVAKLQGQKIQRMVVAGHTDNIGKDAYNLNLSRKRAKAVALSLSRDLDIPIKNIHAVGYGESRPVDSNKTDKGRQNNRRVELKLYY